MTNSNWELIGLCIGIANCLFFAATLWFLVTANRSANRLLAGLLTVLAALFVLSILETLGLVKSYQGLFAPVKALTVTPGPILYFYTITLTGGQVHRSQTIGHFSPFVVYCFLEWVWSVPNAFLWLPSGLSAAIGRVLVNERLTSLLTLGIFGAYLLLSYRRTQGFNRRVPQVASSLDQLQLAWLSKLMVGTVPLWFVLLIYHLTNSAVPGLLISLLFSGTVYYIGYHAVVHKDIFQQLGQDAFVQTLINDPGSGKYQRSSLTDDDKATLRERLLRLMAEGKPYTNPELNLSRLANQLTVSTSHLSQILNEEIGENFYEFVNRYRVDEARRLLVDPRYRHLSVLGIGLEAGFNSKTTFNTTFKKQVGESPSAFQRRHPSG